MVAISNQLRGYSETSEVEEPAYLRPSPLVLFSELLYKFLLSVILEIGDDFSILCFAVADVEEFFQLCDPGQAFLFYFIFFPFYGKL